MISAIRSYWNDGRGPILLRYAVLSYGFAAIEWLLDPVNLLWIFPSLKAVRPAPVFEGALLLALNVLPLLWLVIVIKGIKKSGWPGVILLLPVRWGMFWYFEWAMVFYSCLSGHGCL